MTVVPICICPSCCHASDVPQSLVLRLSMKVPLLNCLGCRSLLTFDVDSLITKSLFNSPELLISLVVTSGWRARDGVATRALGAWRNFNETIETLLLSSI